MFTVKPAVGAKGLSSRVHIGGAKPQARGAVRLSARAQPKTVALFDFFKKKDDEEEEPAPRSVRGGSSGGGSATKPYICLDCGYIYEGDFSKAPFFYKCPVCGVGKNRFVPKGTQGDYYNALAAAKKANKAASREKRKDSPREELKRRQRELAAEKDQGKGGGWFGR